jgi:hypothetical protein
MTHGNYKRDLVQGKRDLVQGKRDLGPWCSAMTHGNYSAREREVRESERERERGGY